MGYHIHISGQHDAATEEGARAFEADVSEQAREFAASLPGVTAADASFEYLSSQSLLADAPPDAQVSADAEQIEADAQEQIAAAQAAQVGETEADTKTEETPEKKDTGGAAPPASGQS